ncbi:MAG: SPFH domain-containing protein [Treponemataceae bacterium]|nr:SPFH domain-containing protein [Treponemataceae bacterium]
MNEIIHSEERSAPSASGMVIMIGNILFILITLGLFIYGSILADREVTVPAIVMMIGGGFYAFLAGPLVFIGLKILKPNEALVLTLFGKYYGTLKGPGFFWVSPFVQAVAPVPVKPSTANVPIEKSPRGNQRDEQVNKKISLKVLTLDNEKQKINDALGNPIIIGIVVVWRVVHTAKAVFNVDNYVEYLSIQCDSALRNIVRLYPYDSPDEENEKSLRGSSQEIAERLKQEIQQKVDIAGLEIIEARITHLSYAPEIATAMLQRQQATAVVAARQLIVEGAVGMVEMALDKLSQKHIIELDEERKAAMVSNLLVVLCSNREAQPVVNTGSIY